MNNKRIPPAVGEFAVGERGKLLARIAEQAREIERLQLTCNDLDDQNERIYAELAALKAQPSGVVLPNGWVQLTIEHEPGYPEDVAFGPQRMMDRLKKWLDRYFEMRLNSSPVSDGDPCMCGGNPHTTQCLYEHFLSYSGLSDQPILRYAYFHGADDHCEKPASAGDEKSEEGLDEWAKGKFGIGGRYTGKLYGNTDWALARVVWSAALSRAALSANHSEQVRQMVPGDDELYDLASSACQMALAHGVGEESFMALARTVRDRCAMLAAAPTLASGVPSVSRLDYDLLKLAMQGVKDQLASCEQALADAYAAPSAGSQKEQE